MNRESRRKNCWVEAGGAGDRHEGVKAALDLEQRRNRNYWEAHWGVLGGLCL